MIKYEIKNRFTGDVQIVAKIDCPVYAQRSFKLRLAVLWALKNGADLRDADLSEADLHEKDLRGADLSGADLRGASLSRANLSWTNFSGVNLRGVYLRGANLLGADIRDADLSWTNFSGANLRGVYLRGANLLGTDFSGVYLSEADLSGIDLSEACFNTPPIIKNIHQSVAAAVQGGRKLDMDYWHHGCGTKHCRAGWVVALAGDAGAKLEKKIGTSAAAALIYVASDPNMKKVPDFHCSDDAALKDILDCAERELEGDVEWQ